MRGRLLVHASARAEPDSFSLTAVSETILHISLRVGFRQHNTSCSSIGSWFLLRKLRPGLAGPQLAVVTSGANPSYLRQACLLRLCGCLDKMLRSWWTVPPNCQQGNLARADRDLGNVQEKLVGCPRPDDDLFLAGLGEAKGGVGARSAWNSR